ncbi:MAG: hypothetical protein AB1428_10955 [Bacteroidota bacterium]
MAQPQETPKKSPDPREEGTSWQFYFVILAIALGVLGIVAKVVGVI